MDTLHSFRCDDDDDDDGIFRHTSSMVIQILVSEL